MGPESGESWLDSGAGFLDTRVLDSMAEKVREKKSLKGLMSGEDWTRSLSFSWDPPAASAGRKHDATLDALREAGAGVDARFGRTLYREGGAMELMTPELRSLWAALGMAFPRGQEELVDEWTRSCGFRDVEDLVCVVGGKAVVTRTWPKCLLTMPSGSVESRQVRLVLEAYVPSGRNLRFALETRAGRSSGTKQWNQLHAKTLMNSVETKTLAGTLVALAVDWAELLDVPLTGEVDKW